MCYVFFAGIATMKKVMKDVIDERKQCPPNSDSELFIDLVLDNAADQEEVLSESIVFGVGGFHTTGNCESCC